MKSVIIYVAITFMISVAVNAQHHGTSNEHSKVTDAVILRQLLTEPGLSGKEVQMIVVNFPPGIVSPPHRHPCETFGYLLEGTLESVFEGKNYSYKKGDAFYELPNGLHSLTRNPSPTDTAKLLVLFLGEKGQATSVREKK
jgi:quercetin dioxygenase-like cupin family protein